MSTERDYPLVQFDRQRPLIVLTNDDGVTSPGLYALRDTLSPLGEVHVVAPDQNRSGSARSITMHTPLWVEEVEWPDGTLAFSTDGTPVDCVRMAALGLLERRPDLIVSGINLGANLGDDTTYSGTVAAALEGLMLDIPAIALSADGYHPEYDLTVPARVAHRLVSMVLSRGFPTKTLLNVNCPDVSWASLRGARLTTLGKRIYGDKVQCCDSQGKKRRYRIYSDRLSYHEQEGSDFEAVAEGYVSITPLQFDLMSHRALDRLRHWENALQLHEEPESQPCPAGTPGDSSEPAG
ncbi:MAG: 5'/3'-nucleotidase SurE [Thermoleophilia bacterium]